MYVSLCVYEHLSLCIYVSVYLCVLAEARKRVSVPLNKSYNWLNCLTWLIITAESSLPKGFKCTYLDRVCLSVCLGFCLN